MNQLTYSKDGLHLTEKFEGCRLTSYQDIVGVWTIGYGHTKDVHGGMTCDQEQAEKWLTEDVKSASDDVNRLVATDLSQNEFDALTDFVFNLGGLAFEKSTMLKFLNAGDHIAAADQFDRWSYAGGKQVAGLLRRRNEEEQLFKGE